VKVAVAERFADRFSALTQGELCGAAVRRVMADPDLSWGESSAGLVAAKKGPGIFCRNGPKGASHKIYLVPFSLGSLMVRQNDIAVLSKALGSGLISVDQFAQFVRELVGDPGQSAELLLCKTGLSDDEVRSLVSSTKPQLSDLTAALPPRPGSLDVTTDSPRRGPDGGTAAVEVPTFSRGVGPPPSPAAAKTPAEGKSAGPQQITAQLRYQIGEEIGRGGLGRVVTARDL